MKTSPLLLLLLSLFLTSCGPEEDELSKNEKILAEFEHDFGVPLNMETAMVYSMGYSGAAHLNRPLSNQELERSIPISGGESDKLRKIYLAGMRDAMERRPNRVEGIEL